MVLTKAPRGGGGKSRLATSMGREVTAELATAFLRDTLRSCLSEVWGTSIHFTPARAHAEMTNIAARVDGGRCVELVPQRSGDLGARILGAMAPSIARGARTVLIGSDTPDLPSRVIAQAFAALERQPLVLGPASDGGFYLIGLNQVPSGLFANVAWSTNSVLETVMSNADRAGLDVSLLEGWHDVDDEQALFALAHRLRRGEREAPATLEAISKHLQLGTGAAP